MSVAAGLARHGARVRITAVERHILRAELREPFAYSQGWFRARTALIVRVRTDQGIDGIGECFGPPEPSAAILDHLYGPALAGSDPLDNEVIWERLYVLLRDHGQKGSAIEALSGVDIALWDIKGKAAGLPAAKLLGGAFRTRVRAYATGFYRRGGLLGKEAELVREAEEHARTGFRAMKIKLGFGLDDDRRALRAVRRAVGEDLSLMADANHAYDAPSAIRLGRELEEARYGWLEEPVPPEDIEGYRRVHDALDIPIAGGEAEFTRFGMRRLLADRLLDIVQPDCCGTGGLTEAKRIAALAGAFGIRTIPHVWGTRIAMAAALHLIASLPPTPSALVPTEPLLEFDCSEHPLRERVVLEEIRLEDDGTVSVPEAAGLGVTLDEEFVKRESIR